MIEERAWVIPSSRPIPYFISWKRRLLLSQLLRAPVGSRLVCTEFDGTTLTFEIASTTPYASCPACWAGDLASR